MDYQVMQSEHREWLARNYPNQPPEVPAAGLVEEAGELIHAALKLKQMGLWGEEGDYTQLRLQAKLEDAVGDVAIYACSCCNAGGWDFATTVAEAKQGFSSRAVPMLLGAGQVISRAVDYTKHRSRAMLQVVLFELVQFAKDAGLDFDDCVDKTWSAVKLRSRRPRRPTIVCLCGSTRFKQLWYDANKEETYKGHIVLGVGDLDTSESNREVNVPISPELKRRLDELHLRKVELADEVLVLNGTAYGAPYIGESTRREIAHATALGKKVRYLNPCV